MSGTVRGPLAAISALGVGDSVRSGLDRYTRTVLKGLLLREDVICFGSAEWLLRSFPDRSYRAGGKGLQQNNFKGNLGRLAWHQTELPRRLRLLKPQLFYCPVSEGMLAPPIPQVVTIHDLLPLRFPEVYPRLKLYYRHVLPRIVGRSSAIIVDSESTRVDVHRAYAPSAPVHVVYPGYDDEVFRPQPDQKVAETIQRYGLGRYLLTVAEARAYKNIGRLIEGFARLEQSDVALAICGSAERLDAGVADLPRVLGIADRVKFLGYVPDGDLPDLYAGAIAFAFPSLYEGFGLPPLEAMACGCPVVASTASSIPEVCGDAAIYVQPESVENIARGLQQVVTDPSARANLRLAGFARVRRFRPASCVSAIGEVLREVADEAAPRRGRAGPASFVNEPQARGANPEQRIAPAADIG